MTSVGQCRVVGTILPGKCPIRRGMYDEPIDDEPLDSEHQENGRKPETARGRRKQDKQAAKQRTGRAWCQAVVYGALIRRSALINLRPALGETNRADMAVLALGLLGAGNLWAPLGPSGDVQPARPAVFVFGFTMIVVAGLLCLLAVGGSSTFPRPIFCAAAIAVPLILVPGYVGSPWSVSIAGLVLAAVPLIRRRRIAWTAVVLGAGIVAGNLIVSWSWGHAPIDVFHEVQGSTQALLHGENPYLPVYSIFLDNPAHHVIYGSASFNYGPVVVLLSLPARLLGDVRVTLVVLNIAILVAALIWLRRAWPGRHFGPTIAALWAASPFIPLMVLNAWTDVFCFAGLAWWLVLRDRNRNWSIVLLALALASKPTMLPLIVPMLFWVRSIWRELLWATAGAVIIVAPFALWTGIPRYVYDTISIFGDLPTRHDSVNVNGLLAALGHGFAPPTLLLVGTVASLALFAVRRPRDYGDLLIAGAGALIVVYLFAKQNFLNYDYNAAMALLFVIAGGSLRPIAPLTSLIRDAVRLASRRRGEATGRHAIDLEAG
jgi:Glycosyltransferase family 87